MTGGLCPTPSAVSYPCLGKGYWYMTQAEAPQEMVLSEQFKNMKSMIDLLKIEVSIGEQDTSTDIASIMENILSGESEEEVFARQEIGSTATKDYLNKPFALKAEDITWKASLLKGDGFTFPFYALLRVTDIESGEELTLNGGGATFVSVLWKLQQLSAFDGFENGRPLILVGKPTASGQTVVLLKPIAGSKRAAARAAK